MEFIIHPYEGVEIPNKGIIRFGMPRDEVRTLFDEKPKELIISKHSELPTDAFFKSTLQVSYRKSDLVKSIAFAQPQNPIFKTEHLLSTPYQELEKWFHKIDSTIETEKYEGLTSHTFGIQVWAPYADEEDSHYVAESIFVFDRNYYEK